MVLRIVYAFVKMVVAQILQKRNRNIYKNKNYDKIVIGETDMKSDYKKITQIINYLIRKDERAASISELKIIKLVWAADRYHIRKHIGATVGYKRKRYS